MSIRVLIVDDSVFTRAILMRHLNAAPDITVVGDARDGEQALALIPELRPDVVTMDVQMPGMGGLMALTRIMAECPLPVIMVSGLTQNGARMTIQCLLRGAVDFVSKPSTVLSIGEVSEMLIEKIRVAAGARSVPQSDTEPRQPEPGLVREHVQNRERRVFGPGDPLIVIGASTGGPRALRTVLSALPADVAAAVVVVQHLPDGFSSALAQRLDESSPLVVREARHAERLALGTVLVAPGGTHLVFDPQCRVQLVPGPRRSGVCPALDETLESAARLCASTTVAVVLTGMGSDGAAGARALRDAGGTVVAEHESSCVIYGMPRSVIEAGAANLVAPLPEVAPALLRLLETWKKPNTIS